MQDKPENISARLPEWKSFELYGVRDFGLGRSQGQWAEENFWSYIQVPEFLLTAWQSKYSM